MIGFLQYSQLNGNIAYSKKRLCVYTFGHADFHFRSITPGRRHTCTQNEALYIALFMCIICNTFTICAHKINTIQHMGPQFRRERISYSSNQISVGKGDCEALLTSSSQSI